MRHPGELASWKGLIEVTAPRDRGDRFSDAPNPVIITARMSDSG
jgi:hypothetical protein